MKEMPGIDIVTRLYDLSDLAHLDRLLFSVMGQAGAVPIQLHVMLQRFSFTEVQAVREATWGLRGLRERTRVMLHNWDNPAPFDLRLPLLNWGLEVAQDRYFTCLDVQEQLYPHACATLLERLQSAKTEVAFGGAALQSARWWGDVIMPVRDREPASRPFFIADRCGLAVADCVFRSNEADLEIDNFIERLAAKYAVDTVCRDDVMVLRICPL